MQTSSRNRLIAWGLLVIAALVNAAGYLWDLYDRFGWFDEAVHAYTTFALTLPLALLLYNVVLTGAQTHTILFVLTVASLGVAIGVLWEIAEWAYDQMVPENAILGKLDTIIDLIMDILGGVVAGIVSVGMVKPAIKR
jgi:VanZ family protein